MEDRQEAIEELKRLIALKKNKASGKEIRPYGFILKDGEILFQPEWKLKIFQGLYATTADRYWKIESWDDIETFCCDIVGKYTKLET